MMPVSQVQPSRASSARDLPALETALAGLALDTRSPIALELSATATSRQFLLRAEEGVALAHLERQIQARYPQAKISPLDTDPLQCASSEECSSLELRPGAASDLPLRTWKTRDLLEEGTDPLLGILAAFGSLPKGTRGLVQLALVPASPEWSRKYRRRAVEHPLEPERLRQAQQNQSETPSVGRIVVLFILVMFLVLAFALRKTLARLVPPWLLTAATAISQGKSPHLTPTQTTLVGVFSMVLLALLLSLMYGVFWIMGRMAGSAIYDQRLVEEKTARPAYRVRLRLLVIGPGEPRLKLTWWERMQAMGADEKLWTKFFQFAWAQAQGTWRRWARTLQRWKRWAKRGKMGFLKAAWHRERARWRKGCADRDRLREWKKQAKARRTEREDLLRMFTATYRQYHLASGGYFAPRRLSARRIRKLFQPSSNLWVFRRPAGWAASVPRSAHFLSVADLAALWHLPQAQDLPDLVYLEHERMRTLLAPAILAKGNGYLLGTSTHAGQHLPVFLPFSCLRQNLLAAASTGKGKSTLFEHLMRALAQARVTGQAGGALLVDPHGDLASHVAGLLPKALVDEIVLIQLSDQEFPIGFNPLDMSAGADRDKIIDNLIAVIEALWPTSYGPRTESFVEYGAKSLAEANLTLIERNPVSGPDEQFTLLDLVPLFRQESFRHAVLELVRDQHLLNWWNNYYEQLDGRQQADFTSSVVTKFSKFASTRISRRILGQPRSSLNFAEIIREEKIVLISCAAGEVGTDLAALFGSLFVGFFQTSLQEQAHLPLAERHRFLVLIDEFQSLVGINYQTMLAELRKYGGSFGLATQSMAYLDRFEKTLRATVLANVDHVFAFTMADEDARLLRLPGIEPEDVTQLPDYTCYARLSLKGGRLPVFSLRLSEPALATDDLRLDIVNRCRHRYGRPVGVVEQVLRDSEVRQRTMRPKSRRNGSRGYEVLWEGEGAERVEEVMDQTKKRGSGRGQGKKKKRELEKVDNQAEHTMYGTGDEEAADARE
jgi:hypothetical protein